VLTDFGVKDGFAAAVKGVLASQLPDVVVDDAGHGIPPGDVHAAMWALGRYWRLYPAGTVHLVVVDPGVGTSRRVLVVEADGRFVVAPDNGIVTRVLDEAAEWKAVAPPAPLGADRGMSATFHGRDVFAPLAARLAAGEELSALGSVTDDPVRLVEPKPIRQRSDIVGQVIATDRFGNLITNVPGEWVSSEDAIRIGERTLALSPTYGSVAVGEATAVVNSDGRLEIAVRGGSAASRLGAGVGVRVEVSRDLETRRRPRPGETLHVE
jgi:S-adenosylmethionine hydrolase